ncbi:MAG: Beta-lactamase domain-containing protein [candidate division CPR2 bacterium GW2011_GWC1_39_9]|uniref:Beta-lactamase domain-containing protein n=1 Tax=candidate division CPR2 bacterium GW2011_GWC2_39_10 TaxID=1618345 RepID=A0A0G0LSE9_UNCC2|nr:MAG: Beta-lactamase domain-containing protein [candidate division CPR2 bacterium GW2011_GWC2_39_10]KKR34686.1 MAG: Beta-lactamase domain-containing protein [candidate division CPR2 bacterium GW2011_GWC1_39_9]
MKITLLGTGSFVNESEHAGPGCLLEINGKNILIDAGSGVQLRLAELGFDIGNLDYFFLTHYHPDHNADTTSILVRYKNLKRFYDPEFNKPLKLFGPLGISDFIESLYKIFAFEDFYNLNNELLEIKELHGQLNLSDFKVTSFDVEHIGTLSKAYRFEADGKIITISGDTVLCSGIKKAAKNADLFICDSSLSKGNKNPAHLTTEEIGKLCKETGVKKVVLTHFLPYAKNVDLLSEVKENFDGEVVLGKDLLELNL